MIEEPFGRSMVGLKSEKTAVHANYRQKRVFHIFRSHAQTVWAIFFIFGYVVARLKTTGGGCIRGRGGGTGGRDGGLLSPCVAGQDR